MGVRLTVLLLFVSLVFSSGMAASDEAAGPAGKLNPPLPSKSGRAAVRKISIKEILDLPKLFKGRDIVLEGTFRGWKGRCSRSFMLTRSDWILDDGTDCIYVTGRVPAGVSPLNPKGERLVISGKVRIGRSGKPFLQARETRQLPRRPGWSRSGD